MAARRGGRVTRISGRTHWFVALRKPRMFRKVRTFLAVLVLLLCVMIAVQQPGTAVLWVLSIVAGIAGWELIKKGRR